MTLTISIIAILLTIVNFMQIKSQYAEHNKMQAVVFDNAESIHKLRTTKQDKAKRGRPRKNAPKPHELNGKQ
tara:strand:- start:1356 stop:1571 length:216 start_codon:yes stop_codon:yes gene_type:complete